MAKRRNNLCFNTVTLYKQLNDIMKYIIETQEMSGFESSLFLNEIGDGIDFLVLETVHVLLGEVLDFLACLPYLTKDAIVVLHNISWNHLRDATSEYTKNAFATKLLFDIVSADKILCKNDTRLAEYPNIAAFHRLWTQYEYIVFYVAGCIGNQFYLYK